MSPESREFDLTEAFERDIDDADVAEQLADEARDDLWQVPTRCLVNGHEFEMYRGLTHCRHCGQDQYDEITSTGMRV